MSDTNRLFAALYGARVRRPDEWSQMMPRWSEADWYYDLGKGPRAETMERNRYVPLEYDEQHQPGFHDVIDELVNRFPTRGVPAPFLPSDAYPRAGLAIPPREMSERSFERIDRGAEPPVMRRVWK